MAWQLVGESTADWKTHAQTVALDLDDCSIIFSLTGKGIGAGDDEVPEGNGLTTRSNARY